MRSVCGADGCKGGWIRVTRDLPTGSVSWNVCPTARDLVYSDPTPKIIAVDIPIGLRESGPRLCDLEARRLLGRGRASSIFPAPIRPLLTAATREEACRIRLAIEGKRVTHQTWGIVPKVREMDRLLRQDPSLQARIREVHPEVSFLFMAGRQPLPSNKKTAKGREERCRLLETYFGESVRIALAGRVKSAAAEDDVLDAFAALWTAERIARGIAETLLPLPPTDRFGLRMEITI